MTTPSTATTAGGAGSASIGFSALSGLDLSADIPNEGALPGIASEAAAVSMAAMPGVRMRGLSLDDTIAPGEGLRPEEDGKQHGEDVKQEQAVAVAVAAEIAVTRDQEQAVGPPAASPTSPFRQWTWRPLSLDVPASPDVNPEGSPSLAGSRVSSPVAGRPAPEQAALPPVKELTAFSRSIAMATANAPERLAEKFVERLQQACLEAAGQGHTSCIWDAQVPGSDRNFGYAVARAFAAQLKELGFRRLQWWSGKEWKDMPGKYLIIHDTMYDKYTMKVQVRWPTECSTESSTDLPSFGAACRQQSSQGFAPEQRQGQPEASLLGIFTQVKQVHELQQQLLQQSLAAEAELSQRGALAEARALRAEERLAALDAAAAPKNKPTSKAPGEDAADEIVPDASRYELAGV